LDSDPETTNIEKTACEIKQPRHWVMPNPYLKFHQNGC